MKVKTTPGLQCTVAVLARAYTPSPNMNHLWGMSQNEPLFGVSFWITGGSGGLPCVWDCSPAESDLWPVCLTFHPPDEPLKTRELD